MTPEEIAALSRAIANLFDRWHVGPDVGARILAIDPELYNSWWRGELDDVDDDLKLRLVLLLNIHVQLTAFIGSSRRGYEWMSKPNRLFGQSPLDMIADGDLNGLLRLQQYLAAEAQG